MLRDLLVAAKTLNQNGMMPELVLHYGALDPEPITGSWERKVHPDWSGSEIMANMIAKKLRHVEDTLNAKAELQDDFPTQINKWKFDKCVQEMRDQIREEDIINKDVVIKEFEYFYGGRVYQ
jgi:L-arabinose isomerase